MISAVTIILPGRCGLLFTAIIEDNPKGAKILKEYIESDDVKVVAVYRCGEDALREIPSYPLPDVVLVDIGLPGISGIEVIRSLKEQFPELELIVQTVFEDSQTIVDAIHAGASGYVLKASPREEYLKALWEAKRGGSFLTGKIARKILQEFHENREGAKEHKAPAGGFDLTEREQQILNELIKGAAFKEIGDRLHISIHTVGNHIRKIYQKMRVNSRGEAVAKATNQTA